MLKKCKLLLLLIVTLPAFASPQTPVASKQNQLGKLTKDIKKLQQNLTTTEHKRDETINSLKKTDLNIASTSKTVTSLTNKINLETKQLEKLQFDAKLKQEALSKQQLLLQQQLKTAYALGKNSYIKILLNQEDPAQISRIKSYYHFLNEARVKIMENIQKLLEEIAYNQQQILHSVKELQALRDQEQQKRQQLQQLKSEQGQIVHQLSTEITTSQQHLNQLIANKKALENIIQNLSKLARGFSDSNQPFAKERGHLHWPTKGTIAKHFGTPIGQSQLFYSGILLHTSAGQPVYAAHRGRVVFADWLKGFGLLLIIEHDHGYMTLYAHNDNLYKKSGEIVEGGEMIATSGNSGGNVENGLYFEIRANGKPQNPESWLSKNA